jgi:hypothetical protein
MRAIGDQHIPRPTDLLTGKVLTGTPEGSTTIFTRPLLPGSYRLSSVEQPPA